jgi:hypothetical protein
MRLPAGKLAGIIPNFGGKSTKKSLLLPEAAIMGKHEKTRAELFMQ